MSSIFGDCFGKSTHANLVHDKIVTEVLSAVRTRGKCLIEPLESDLITARKSRSLRKLETAVGAARKSGLLTESKVYAEEQKRLLSWKIASSRLLRSVLSEDPTRIRPEIEQFKKFNLLDEDGLLRRAESTLYLLQIVQTIQEAIDQQNIQDLVSAIKICKEFKSCDNIDEKLLKRLSDLKEKAKSLIVILQKEQYLIKRNPNFPREELEKATNSRDVEHLKAAIKRWSRLQRDQESIDYKCAVRVLGQLIELKRLVALQGLETSLKQRNMDGIKSNIQLAQDADLPANVIDFYVSKVLPILTPVQPVLVDLISLIRRQDFSGMVPQISACLKLEALLNVDDVTVGDVVKSDITARKDEYGYDDVIEVAKQEIVSFCKEAREVITSSKCIVRSFMAKQDAQNEMKIEISNFNKELSKIATDYVTNVPDPLREQEAPRAVLLRVLNPFLCERAEKYAKLIEVTKASHRAFNVALKQNGERMSGSSMSSHKGAAGFDLSDLNLVNEAEAILGVIRRCVSISSAEKSLLLFQDAPLSPRDMAEVENTVEHIERSLKALTTSELYKSSDASFIDLCYNRPPEADILRINSETNDPLHQILASLEMIFPKMEITKVRKSAELRLAELQLQLADLEAEGNSVRYNLGLALNLKSESEITRALKASVGCLKPNDLSVQEAETKLAAIQAEKQKCRETLYLATLEKNKAGLESALAKADEIYVAPSDLVVVNARQELRRINFDLNRKKEVLGELKFANQSGDLNAVKASLAQANVRMLGLEQQEVKEAIRLLDCESKKRQESKEEATKEINKIKVELGDEVNLEKARLLVNSSKYLETKLFLSQCMLNSGNNDCKALAVNALELCLDGFCIAGGNVTEDVVTSLQHVVDDFKRLSCKVPPDVMSGALSIVHEFNENKSKSFELMEKLKQAVESNSIDDIASAIVSAETSNLIGFNDEEYELLARVKEKFALLKEQKRCECSEKITLRVSSARKRLKMSMINETDPENLRKALEEFRMVCKPIELNKENPNLEVFLQNEQKKENRKKQHMIQRSKVPVLRLKPIDMNIVQPPRLKRPSSAIVHLHSSPPAPRIVWGGEKNLQLIRKAEKNLRKLEMVEQERREEEENKIIWRKMRSGLADNLRNSMEFGDRAEMWRSIHEFTRYIDEDTLDRAELELLRQARRNLQRLTAQQYQENLTNAISQRKTEMLESILYQIENESPEFLPNRELDHTFYCDVTKGQQLLSHLCELKKFRSAVMSLTRSLVSEITSYPSPPEAVKEVMSATYLLLGEDEKTIKSWSSLHSLMGKLGRDSLTRRVARCDSSNIPLHVAQKAWGHVSELCFDKVKAINHGASTFFAWVTCMVNEVYSRNGIDIPQRESKLPRRFPARRTTRKLSSEFWQRIARPNGRLSMEYRNAMSRRSKRVLKRPRTAKY